MGLFSGVRWGWNSFLFEIEFADRRSPEHRHLSNLKCQRAIFCMRLTWRMRFGPRRRARNETRGERASSAGHRQRSQEGVCENSMGQLRPKPSAGQAFRSCERERERESSKKNRNQTRQSLTMPVCKGGFVDVGPLLAVTNAEAVYWRCERRRPVDRWHCAPWLEAAESQRRRTKRFAHVYCRLFASIGETACCCVQHVCVVSAANTKNSRTHTHPSRCGPTPQTL